MSKDADLPLRRDADWLGDAERRGDRERRMSKDADLPLRRDADWLGDAERRGDAARRGDLELGGLSVRQ
jgi:hypothetical protein